MLHDLKSGTKRRLPIDVVHSIYGREFPYSPAASLGPDGQLMALFGNNKIAVWNAVANSLKQKALGKRAYIIGAHFASPSLLLFVLAEPDRYDFGPRAGSWNLATDQDQIGPPVRGPRVDMNDTAVLNLDGSKAVIWGINHGDLRLYGNTGGSTLRELPFPGNVQIEDDSAFSVVFDGDGKRVAIGGDRKIAAWDLAEQKVLKEVEYDGNSDVPVALSRDGRWLATSDHGNVIVYDLNQQGSEQSARTLEVACSLRANNAKECIRRLCEKVSASITDKALSEALGNFDSERLRQRALDRPCAEP